MTITDKIIPNLVGVDIGCGMAVTGIAENDIDFTELDETIRNRIPCGFSIHESMPDFIKTKVSYFINETLGKIKAPFDRDRAEKSLGTLGGGNHFIEIDKDDSGQLWLIVHSGSRHLGKEICEYYQNQAVIACKTSHNAEIIQKLKAENRQSEIQAEIEKNKNSRIPDVLAYCENQLFDDYMHDMYIAQLYAMYNREMMTKIIMDAMHLTTSENRSYNEFHTLHNYIDTKNMILRKGAVSAQKNEPLVIPMNMRDGTLLCVGKGNPDWNYSAPHGAGRIMSRSQAKQLVSMSEYEESMKGIFSTSVCESTIDESPMVYKPMQEIMDNIKDTVDIIGILKPVYNFKAN